MERVSRGERSLADQPEWQVLYGARSRAMRSQARRHRMRRSTNCSAHEQITRRVALHVSPRLGFNYNRSGQIRNAQIASGLGRFTSTTPGVLRGGIGEFRGMTPASLLSTALVSTGLPGSQTRLSCIGAAVPRADWAAYGAQSSAIPSSCAGGASVFADAAPNVLLFDRCVEHGAQLAEQSRVVVDLQAIQLHARRHLLAQSQPARCRTI